MCHWPEGEGRKAGCILVHYLRFPWEYQYHFPIRPQLIYYELMLASVLLPPACSLELWSGALLHFISLWLSSSLFLHTCGTCVCSHGLTSCLCMAPSQCHTAVTHCCPHHMGWRCCVQGAFLLWLLQQLPLLGLPRDLESDGPPCSPTPFHFCLKAASS